MNLNVRPFIVDVTVLYKKPLVKLEDPAQRSAALAAQPVSALCGIGDARKADLGRHGIRTVGDFAKKTPVELNAILSNLGYGPQERKNLLHLHKRLTEV